MSDSFVRGPLLPGEDVSFYEILDVPEDASAEDIERAYRIAASTYQPGSTAVYSVFSEEQSAELLRQVERAFGILSDPRKRRDYDARRRSPAPSVPSRSPLPPRAPEPRPRASSMELRSDVGLPEPQDGVYDGPALHRIRVSRGIELEEVAAVTKINPDFLRSIEANRYEQLPAPVYVKGFVREIARLLHLDPGRVCETYMQRYREQTGTG
jgi:flagellar biosynthesis protein FlhG